MIKYKYGNTSFELPTGWHEVGLCKWLKIKECKTVKEIVSVLTGVTEIDDNFLIQLAPQLSWLDYPIDSKEWTMPDELLGVKTDIDISCQTFMQKIVLQNLVAGAKDTDKIMAESISIYLQPFVSRKKFNYGKAKKLINEVEQLPLCKVYPVAGFFLSSCQR